MAPTYAERRQAAQRRTRALALRQAGWTYQAIADELGLKSRAQAAMDVRNALAPPPLSPYQQRRARPARSRYQARRARGRR